MTDTVTRWDQSVDEYQRYVQEYPQYDELNDALTRFATLTSDDTVFDIGCGTGETTERILKASPQTTVVGIDPAPSMTTHYTERFPGLTAYTCSAKDAPFNDEQPSKAVLNASIWYTDLPAFLQAAHRSDPTMYVSINQTFLTFTDTAGHRSTFTDELISRLTDRGYDAPSLKRYSESEFANALTQNDWEISRSQTVGLTSASPKDSAAFFSIPGVAPFFDDVPRAEQHEILKKTLQATDRTAGTNQWMLYELTPTNHGPG